MDWIDVKNKLPKSNDQKILFITKDIIYFGWFRKRHELHGEGLFGCEINHDKEYFTPKEVSFWLPIPEQPERSKREDFLTCPDCKYFPLEQHVALCIGETWRCAKCFGEFLREDLLSRCGALNTMET